MFCPECGRKNDDNAVFCENCGTRLNNASMPKESIAVNDIRGKIRLPVNKILLVELGAALLSFVIFSGVYNARYSAKSTAERYVKAKYECNWDEVYDTRLVEESGDFMTKEAFITASAMNYDTVEPAEMEVVDVEKKSGGLSSATYIVNYNLLNEPGDIEVKLKRKGFTWKVDTQEYIVENYSVLVPSGAKIKIDKIDVPEKMKVSERKKGFDTYEIPKIFGNTHYVEIEGENLKATGQLVTGYGQEDVSGTECIVRTGYDDQTIETVMKQAEADLGEILNAAASNKRFSEVAVFGRMSETNKEGMISDYDYLRNTIFENGNSGRSLLKYQLTNGEIKGKATGDEEEGVSLIQIELKGQCYMEKQYKDWDGKPNIEDTNGTDIYELRYVNEDNTWKLYDMYIDGNY